MINEKSMKSIFVLLGFVLLAGFSYNSAFSQEIGLATFQETAQVIIDKSISQDISASITLQSTSVQEIKIPAELEQKIRENSRVNAVILTNEDHCVLGVVDQACIMINIERSQESQGIVEIQETAKEIASTYIGEINDAFDTDAKFFQVYVHTDDQSNRVLDTSGIVSGRGVISAVYTMPMEDTSSMYEKITAITIPKEIRDAGGFYDIAKKMSQEGNSKMTLSIIPLESKSLMQLKLATSYQDIASDITNVSPLEFLKVDKIKRSDYFSTGFYPLNSLIQVVVLSPEDTEIAKVRGNIIPTEVIDGEKLPTDITKQGWVFDPDQGQRIQGKYIFGEESEVEKSKLEFSLGEEQDNNMTPPPQDKTDADESLVVVAIITVGAVGAAMFYLKGYARK